jgi:hypothetical protein
VIRPALNPLGWAEAVVEGSDGPSGTTSARGEQRPVKKPVRTPFSLMPGKGAGRRPLLTGQALTRVF